MKNVIISCIITFIIYAVFVSAQLIFVDKGGNHAFNIIDKKVFEQIP